MVVIKAWSWQRKVSVLWVVPEAKAVPRLAKACALSVLQQILQSSTFPTLPL
jgi:hypothetical protein